MSTVQKAQFILTQTDSMLGKLLEKAKQLTELDKLIKGYLGPKLAEHCQVCNLRNGRLVIMTQKAVYATRLKYEIPELLARLREREGFQGLIGIDCKVSPELESPPSP